MSAIENQARSFTPVLGFRSRTPRPPTGAIELLRESNPTRPELDMGITGAILHSIAARCAPATIRIFRPGPTVAFGRRDKHLPGFAAAGRVALAHGYTPLLRHAGGHAVVYDNNSIIIDVPRPEEEHLVGNFEARFTELSRLIHTALNKLGVELELGELPNEYCPGRFSLHLPDGPKVAGIAQRAIRGASLTTAVLTVGSTGSVRSATSEIYAALALPLAAGTVGAVADRFPDLDTQVVVDAVADLALRQMTILWLERLGS
jgi:lipoate-protein ligase A